MKSSFLVTTLLAFQQATAFAPIVSNQPSLVTRFGLADGDLEEGFSWKDAAAATTGCDASAHTTSVVSSRIHSTAVDNVTQDKIEEAMGEFMSAHEQVERRYDAQLKARLKKANHGFVKAVQKAEKEFAMTMARIEGTFERALNTEKTQDCLDRAKSHYVCTTAATEELFQIAIEKADLKFEEAKIKAQEIHRNEVAYFEENGSYMRNGGNYFSTFFGDLIAFSGI